MKTYSQIVGDGGSQVYQQIFNRHTEIGRRLSGITQILLIGSGKGGVGKSAVTMQLACSFHLAGLRVSVLDADFNGPSQARFFGLTKVMPFPGEQGLIPPVTADGIQLISYGSFLEAGAALEFDSIAQGESYTWRQTKEFSVFAELLSNISWGEKDILVVDLPPGPERTAHFAEFFAELGLSRQVAVVLVTIPTTISREVVARSFSAIRNTRAKILGYIENMSGYYCDTCKSIRPLFVEGPNVKLKLPCLGQIPFDAELAAGADQGANVQQFSSFPSSINVQAISRRLQSLLEASDEVSVRAM